MIRTKGDTLAVYLDDDEASSFVSERITNMTEASVSVTTYVNNVHFDDYSIRVAPTGALESE
ncbi:hypothetical protein N9406_12505 [Verrucomicrobiales bacterium]|nr:hypothetical protein [Verrucomicrobiales bacterium]